MTTPVHHAPYNLNTTGFVEQIPVTLDTEVVSSWLDNAKWEDLLAYNPVKQSFYRQPSTPRAVAFSTLAIAAPSCIQDARQTALRVIRERGLMPANASIDHLCYFSRLFPEDSIPLHDDTGRIEYGDDTSHVAFSIMLYLNQAQGGALLLPDNKTEIPASPGNMVIFSADVKHGPSLVTSGYRDAVLFRVYEVEKGDR